MNSQPAIIAFKDLGDRLRSGWVLACVVVWVGAICLTSIFGLVQIGRIGFQGYDRTVLSLLNLVQYLVPLLGLLLGHDAVVTEREERTLALVLASGVSRINYALGKLLGAILTLSVPLVLGFVLAGIAIAAAAGTSELKAFLLLALASLVLGIVFVTLGWCLSILCRTRLKALVLALLVWGGAVFAFDLLALGILVKARTPALAAEIEALCDPTHVNAAASSAADLHASYEASTTPTPAGSSAPRSPSWSWLWLNPIDLFRAVNLSALLNQPVPSLAIPAGILLWCGGTVVIGLRRMQRLDV